MEKFDLYLVSDAQEGKNQHVTIEKTFNSIVLIGAFYVRGVES